MSKFSDSLSFIFNPSPRGRIRWAVFGILILAFLAGLLDYPKYYDKSVDALNSWAGFSLSHFYQLPFRLGLDLQGGTHLLYEADMSQIPDKDRANAVEGARDVIERRVNAFGVSEPVVQTNKAGETWRIIVELAGVKDVGEAIKMIGETPLLEFKEQGAEQQQMTEEQKKQLEDYNKEAKDKANQILKEVLKKSADFASLAKEKSEDTSTKDKGGDLGFIKEGGQYSEFFAKAKLIGKDVIYYQLIETSEGYNIIKRGDRQEAEEVKASHILICYKGASRCEKDTSKEDAKKKIEELKAKVTKDNFVELAKENSTEPGAESSGGDLGWFSRGMMVKPFEDVIFNMKKGEISDIVETEFGYHLIFKADTRSVTEYEVSRILIKTKKESDILPPASPWKYTGLTGKQLKKAQVQFDPNTNEPNVSLEFNDEGKELFAEITERNIGKPVAIFLDGSPITTPTVQEAIKEGKAVITGKFNLKEAKQLAQRLNAGALPVPIKLISQQTVGASLGTESVQKSLYAGVVGLLAVALFMILFYRLPGIISVIALLIYGVIVLAIFKLVHVTLTLAGIAGFNLSVGMAVDANILIFERLKEELRAGKSLGQSIDEGFRRAWTSIRDSNFSSLITCVILIWFGSSIIKGFAITLAIGILVSMFSAITTTRILLKLMMSWLPQEKLLWLWGRIKKPKLEIES
jgi:protein-export membrane protein SecD